MWSIVILLLITALRATAKHLFVASYSGFVTTLDLATTSNGSYKLSNLSTTFAAAPAPSWLTLDPTRKLLYAVNEGSFAPQNGSLTAFKIGNNGKLVLASKVDTLFGPVHAALYNYGNMTKASMIALADYGSAAVQAFSLAKNGSFTPAQTLPFMLPRPGPKPAQDVSRPHSVTLDPTGNFLIVPDLGADLVRIFRKSNNNMTAGGLVEQTPLVLPPGSGPRWARFNVATMPKNVPVYLYVLSELASTITTFEVSYATGGAMVVREMGSMLNYRPNATMPMSNAAAQLSISPDRKFLIASNRNDSSFALSSTNTTMRGDSMVGYKIDPVTGALEFQQFFSAGGRFPRQFSINKKGNLIAVGLQTDSKVAILARNVTTGMVGGTVAEMMMEGPVGCVVWDE